MPVARALPASATVVVLLAIIAIAASILAAFQVVPWMNARAAKAEAEKRQLKREAEARASDEVRGATYRELAKLMPGCTGLVIDELMDLESKNGIYVCYGTATFEGPAFSSFRSKVSYRGGEWKCEELQYDKERVTDEMACAVLQRELAPRLPTLIPGGKSYSLHFFDLGDERGRRHVTKVAPDTYIGNGGVWFDDHLKGQFEVEAFYKNGDYEIKRVWATKSFGDRAKEEKALCERAIEQGKANWNKKP